MDEPKDDCAEMKDDDGPPPVAPLLRTLSSNGPSEARLIAPEWELLRKVAPNLPALQERALPSGEIERYIARPTGTNLYAFEFLISHADTLQGTSTGLNETLRKDLLSLSEKALVEVLHTAQVLGMTKFNDASENAFIEHALSLSPCRIRKVQSRLAGLATDYAVAARLYDNIYFNQALQWAAGRVKAAGESVLALLKGKPTSEASVKLTDQIRATYSQSELTLIHLKKATCVQVFRAYLSQLRSELESLQVLINAHVEVQELGTFHAPKDCKKKGEDAEENILCSISDALSNKKRISALGGHAKVALSLGFTNKAAEHAAALKHQSSKACSKPGSHRIKSGSDDTFFLNDVMLSVDRDQHAGEAFKLFRWDGKVWQYEDTVIVVSFKNELYLLHLNRTAKEKNGWILEDPLNNKRYLAKSAK